MSCASELRGRALDALADPAWVKGVIRRIGEELGVHPEVLRFWVKMAQVDGGLRPGTTTDEAQRIKEPALGGARAASGGRDSEEHSRLVCRGGV